MHAVSTNDFNGLGLKIQTCDKTWGVWPYIYDFCEKNDAAAGGVVRARSVHGTWKS